jgi:hypothetical protein
MANATHALDKTVAMATVIRKILTHLDQQLTSAGIGLLPISQEVHWLTLVE